MVYSNTAVYGGGGRVSVNPVNCLFSLLKHINDAHLKCWVNLVG